MIAQAFRCAGRDFLTAGEDVRQVGDDDVESTRCGHLGIPGCVITGRHVVDLFAHKGISTVQAAAAIRLQRCGGLGKGGR